jgi:hypothetical protein
MATKRNQSQAFYYCFISHWLSSCLTPTQHHNPSVVTPAPSLAP